MALEDDELKTGSESKSEPEEVAVTRFEAGFGLCGSACGSWSSTWVGPYGGVPMVISATFAPSWAELHPEASAHEHEIASNFPE